MHPSPDITHAPGLVAFADQIRTVLRVRYDSPVNGPDALESWSISDGYEWRWSTPAGVWWLTTGGRPDPRPLLRGPGGFWRLDMVPDQAAGAAALILLRAASAIPADQASVATGRSPVPHRPAHPDAPPRYAPPTYAAAAASSNSGSRWGTPHGVYPETVGPSGYGLDR